MRAMTRFPQVKSVYWGINDRPSEVTNVPSRLLWGEDAIEEELCGLRFRVRPNAFLQTNTAMAEKLYELAIEYAGLEGGETVYDLYCGTGTIGLVMAKNAMTVWGVEASEESVACAIENAELNGIGNAAFFAGEVGRSLEELRERAGPPDVVVVDPPRAGLSGKALRQVARLEAPRLVYVSCNPTTLAGNVKQLAADWGYSLVRARPVDMFPHTPARRDRGSACADFGRALGSKLVNSRRAGMPRKFVTLLVIASFATLVFAFAGCGGDDNSASGDTTTTETTTTEESETTETETTETEDTESTDTETTDTTETSGDDFATSENCEEFAQIGSQVSEAITGSGNVDDIKSAFDQLAAAAPAEIKADFETLAEYMGTIAEALQGVDLTSGETPIHRHSRSSRQIDATEATTASTNISKWVTENCTGTTGP